MSISGQQIEPVPGFSFRLSEIMLDRIAKIAAVLFALYFTYFLKSSFLHYATEPKVIGGVDLDRAVPQTMLWSPVYYPLLLAALFAYWTWPKRRSSGVVRRLFSGSFAVLRIELFSLFASFLCTHFGEFYLSYPLLLKSEILPALASVFIASAKTTAFMAVFLALPMVGSSVVLGCLIAMATHFAAKYLLQQQSCSSTPEGVGGPLNTFPAMTLWSWLSLLAGSIAAAIMLAGVKTLSFWIFTYWTQDFVKVALPCLAIGGVIGAISKRWVWCVVISLSIGYYLSIAQTRPAGFLASQSIDFPPVLFAILAGFVLARKFAPRIFPWATAN
jgi:hypothetical protein